MKKFVSLVLVLALALSLCTVAMAAGVSYADIVTYNKNTEADAAAWNDAANAAVTLVEASAAKVNTENNKKVSYVAEYNLVATDKDNGNKTTGTDKYVKTTADSKHDAVVVNGKTVTYLLKATPANAGFYADCVTKVAAKANDAATVCGTIYYSDEDTTLYKIKDAKGEVADGYYVESATGTVYMMVGDTVLTLTKLDEATAKADATAVAGKFFEAEHVYKIDTTATNGKTVVSKVYCSECKASFEFVQGSVADAIAKFGEGNYTVVTNGMLGVGGDANTAATINGKSLFIKDVAAAAGTTSTTVDSSKTFDAGVAMYVGLSLMSVAGSAVVIGKKKEF